MTSGEHFPTQAGVGEESVAGKIRGCQSRLVIGELTHQIIVTTKPRVAEKGVRRGLQHLLSLGHAPAFVGDKRAWAYKRDVARRQLLLHLQEERIVRIVPEEQHDVVTRADAAGADQFERHVGRPIAFKGRSAAGIQGRRIVL